MPPPSKDDAKRAGRQALSGLKGTLAQRIAGMLQRDPELLSDMVELGLVRREWLDDPTFGDLMHQGPAYKMSETPPRLKWALKPVGADNEHILGKLAGLSSEDLRRLEEQECI